jgi:16S rRNA (guanine1207-N2)-methyltransferase
MSHYFSKNLETKSEEKTLDYTFKEKSFKFISDHGVFSKDHVDYATDLLLNHISLNENDRVLDLGCGYGVIGIVLATYYKAKVTMIDVNERALNLTNKNLHINQVDAKVQLSEGFAQIHETFKHIVSNPPIRIGKQAMYQLFLDAKTHLADGGSLWLVMHKKHGAISAMDYLKQFYQVHVIKKQKGFHIIQCIKHVD